MMQSSLKSIEELLFEWENLINELSLKEEELYILKNKINGKSELILKETDFQTLYGANNQKIRDNHIKELLKTDYQTRHDLEMSIDYIHRRISFLRELIRYKQIILEEKINE